MASVCITHDRKTILAATMVAACLCGLSGRSSASPASWVKQALALEHRGNGREAAAPPVARYAIEGGRAYVFDRSGRWPLLKFDDSPEVWVLSASRGPRGDMIYKNELGQTLLRATQLGGMTVFTHQRPEGAAAALVGPAAALRLTTIGPVALTHYVYLASHRSSLAAQHIIGFVTKDDAGPESDGLFADAAIVTMQAAVNLGARPGGEAALSRVETVELAIGGKANVFLNKGVLTVTIVPSLGFAGRPSSVRIMQALGAK